MSRPTGYQYIAAASVVVNIADVKPVLHSIPSLTQAAELAALSPVQQKEVAFQTNFATATVKDVKEAVKKKRQEPIRPSPTAKPEPAELPAADSAIVRTSFAGNGGLHRPLLMTVSDAKISSANQPSRRSRAPARNRGIVAAALCDLFGRLGWRRLPLLGGLDQRKWKPVKDRSFKHLRESLR